MSLLDAAIAVFRHPREVGERVTYLIKPMRGLAAVFLNTPEPIDGRLAPAVMLESACSWLQRRAPGSASAAALQLLDTVDTALRPFSAPPFTEESFDARWDLGGHAGLVVADESDLVVARVGDLRVLQIVDGTVQTLLEEHTLAAQVRRDPRHIGADLSSVAGIITSCLGAAAIPIPVDAVSRVEVLPKATVIIGSSYVLDRVTEATLVDCAKNSVESAADLLVAAYAASVATHLVTGVALVVRRGFVDATA